MIQSKGGWLKNQQRKQRQENPNTFTDEDGKVLLEKIDATPNYVSRQFGIEVDWLMRTRDKALISTNWLWLKRANEVLGLRRKNVRFTEAEILVTFKISKKKKRAKYCPRCSTRNGYKSRWCRQCRSELETVQITVEGEDYISTKQKTLDNLFVKQIILWIKAYDLKFPGQQEGLLFPPLKIHFGNANYDIASKPMSVQHYDRILQRLDPRLTSCMFRYGGTEKGYRLGYTSMDMKEIGDWESSIMPERYALKKGLTKAQKRWSEEK